MDTGYVGLITGACFAAIGNTPTCVDTDAAKFEGLPKTLRKRGEIRSRRVVSTREIRKMTEKRWPLRGREMGNGEKPGLRAEVKTKRGTMSGGWTYVNNLPSPLFWLYLPLHMAVNAVTR